MDLGDEELEGYLFENTMKGQWDNVVRAFKRYPGAYKTKITKSGDTALHRAVSDDETEVALRLVEIVDEMALSVSNEQGNTPLHLASALGNLKLCQAILSKRPQVFEMRNQLGETPIFLAALHGEESVFLSLYKYDSDERYQRRSNGDTVLHVTITFEYFRMAIKIIRLHKNFVDSKNEDGLSPLHILANKPSAFKSSTRLGRLDRIAYNCLVVDETDRDDIVDIRADIESTKTKQNNNYPDNYQNCMTFYGLLKNILLYSLFQGQKSSNRYDIEENSQPDNSGSMRETIQEQERGPRKFPPNCSSLVLFFQLIMKAILAVVILGFGIRRLKKLYRKKKLHIWAKRAMDEMVDATSSYRFKDSTGETPRRTQIDTTYFMFPDFDPEVEEDEDEEEELDYFMRKRRLERKDYGMAERSSKKIYNKKRKESHKKGKPSTPVLIAAKMGVTEMVEKILDVFPVAIEDLDSEGKNAALLAIENRQPQVYGLLLERYPTKRRIFQIMDNDNNSALHMAARFTDNWSWRIPRSVVQMHQEIKWYKFVKNSIQPEYFFRRNKEAETPKEVFIMTHRELIRDVNEWLNRISEACSVVAVLIASVTFATIAAVPGGVKSEGIPTLEDKPAFRVFSLSSVVAFCSSVTSLVFFLSILASRYQYALDFPLKVFLGFSSLFLAIASMLASFLTGNLFVLNEGVRHVAYLLYAALCFPLIYLAFTQFSLYLDLVGSILRKLPKHSHM